ncbi:hypothetical protein GL213_09030 [Halogeometricum borinquense]|uniref:Uncharacterized protein n=1 Tax=Halogeometricum borinquense TaxID=60847 RepID=A0A6C0UHR5_9EURY|nr:DUF6789 family protein [Halogeometricum borinquense]QIB74143.1 hypothetical protein G3I44_07445 [Halogeometricum borinquense]QIQ76650.1 hypothetical protein GL213_09030 [Halogeometricum borinquense]
MNRPLAAVAGGFSGTTVLTVLLLLFEVETRSQIGMFEVVARFVGVPGNTTVGFALFVLAGTVAWPLLFVAAEESIPGTDPAIKGMGVGALLWIPFVLLGRGDLAGAIVLAFGGMTLVAHLAYGYVTGAVYARLTGRTPPTESFGDDAEPM